MLFSHGHTSKLNAGREWNWVCPKLANCPCEKDLMLCMLMYNWYIIHLPSTCSVCDVGWSWVTWCLGVAALRSEDPLVWGRGSVDFSPSKWKQRMGCHVNVGMWIMPKHSGPLPHLARENTKMIIMNNWILYLHVMSNTSVTACCPIYTGHLIYSQTQTLTSASRA